MDGVTHISIRDLTVWYGQHQALNHVTVDIPVRKITAIIGPSGCGKTTLLKALNRLVELQDGVRVSGQVLMDGEDIYGPGVEVTRLRKKVGLLFQRPQVLPMSIYGNVAYGPSIHGVKQKKRLDQIVERRLQEASLWNEVKDRLLSPASRLSIGQQQRLCLARALAVEPQVILGDEPTSALDPISGEGIERRLLDLKEQYTIVLVTHILQQAQRLADYVIFLYLGDLIEHGPADQILHRPRYLKTQAYLEGKFIEEPEIHQQLNLKGTLWPADVLGATARALQGLGPGEVLKILVDQRQAVGQIPGVVEAEGRGVLEVKRLNQDDWAMIIQKKGISYAI